MSTTSDRRHFVVVYRAAAAVRFSDDGFLKVNSLRTPTGTLDLTFRTRYDDAGVGAKVPRELWIDARGTADNLHDAINRFGDIVTNLLPQFAVSENAAILDLKAHVAFENTSGATEREFFQSFLPDERGLPRVARTFNAEASVDFVKCVGRMKEEKDRDRLLRACGQYQRALASWEPGLELLALAHLYMGVEALTEVVLRQECAKRGTDLDGLAQQLGVPVAEKPKKCVTCEITPRSPDLLRPAIREKLIFSGDHDCYIEAKKASDGFEHGYLAFSELHPLARSRRNQTATYLRQAIIEAAGCGEKTRNDLLKNEVPVGAWRLVRYLRGWLVGSGNELAAPGQEYPILRWSSGVQELTKTPTGELALKPKEQITPSLGEGISFKVGSFEVWGPDTGRKREPIRQQVTPTVTPAKPVDPAHDRMLQFLEELRRSILDYGANEAFSGTLTDAFTLAIFGECRSRFSAVVLLLKHGLANEAVQLAHGIYRNLLRLQALVGTDDKHAIMLGWLSESISTSGELEQVSKEAGIDLGPGLAIHCPDLTKQKVEAIAKTNGTAVRGFPPEVSGGDGASQLAHVGYLVSRRMLEGQGPIPGYCKNGPADALGFNDICEDTGYLSFVASFAAESMLLACRAVGQLFQWAEFADSDRLLDAVRTRTFALPIDGENKASLDVLKDPGTVRNPE